MKQFKIGQIHEQIKKASVIGKLIKRIELKTVSLKKTKETIEVAEYIIADDTGYMIYQVWGGNEILETDKLIGKSIHIHDGWVSSFANKLRISKGKVGTVEVLDEDIPTISLEKYQLESIKSNNKQVPSEFVKVNDLKKNSKNINIKLKIARKDEPRTVKNGQLTVGTFKVGDETGCILLTLWNEEISQFEEGDYIEINNGYISVFRDIMQLNKGKYGTIKKIEDNFEVNEDNNLSLDY